MKPICVPCQRFFRPKKNGFYFIEGKPERGAMPGTAEPEKWTPYKVWAGDVWECQGCFTTIIVGTGHSPLREDYHDDFNEVAKQLGANQFQVNDC